MNAITKQDEARDIAPAGRSDQLLGMIMEAARDPTIDAGKMDTMARLAMDLQDRERKTQFNRDLALAMMEMPRISKNGKIVIPAKDGRPERVQGTYGKYEDLDRVVKPILAKHNLVLRFKAASEGVMTTITPILLHINGYTDEGEAVKFPADKSGSKNEAQAVVSAMSYAKRAAATVTLNLVFEGTDTDGYPGGFIPSDPIIDWQARALEGAEIAAKEGKESYEKWFETQQPKVRQWLVRSGNHARCGGAEVALPPPKPDVSADAPPKDANPPSDAKAGGEDRPDANPPAPRTTGGKKTPRQWADVVKADIDKCHDTDQLDIFLDRKRDELNRLNRAEPDLWEEINNYAHDRRAVIEKDTP